MKEKSSMEPLDIEMSRSERGEEWLISYSDLVTVLLCFFILFFVIKARQQEKVFKETLTAEKQDEVIKAVGKSMESTTLRQHYDMERLHQHVLIKVRKPHLFEGKQLSLEGKYHLANIADLTYRFLPNIMLQIALGPEHNFEQAIEVRDYLNGLGFKKEFVSIGSFERGPASRTDEDSIDEIRVLITRNYQETKDEN
jgi:hypothetical protein